MIKGAKNSMQTLDSFSDTIKIRHERAQNLGSQVNESVDEQISLGTDSIFRQIEKLCILLADWTDSNTTKNNEATDTGREKTSTTSEDNQYDTRCTLHFTFCDNAAEFFLGIQLFLPITFLVSYSYCT